MLLRDLVLHIYPSVLLHTENSSPAPLISTETHYPNYINVRAGWHIQETIIQTIHPPYISSLCFVFIYRKERPSRQLSD